MVGTREKLFRRSSLGAAVCSFGSSYTRVTAEEVDALLGVVGRNNASKGVITTTAEFAPGIAKEPEYSPLIPQKLELVEGTALVPRLLKLSSEKPFE